MKSVPLSCFLDPRPMNLQKHLYRLFSLPKLDRRSCRRLRSAGLPLGLVYNDHLPRLQVAEA